MVKKMMLILAFTVMAMALPQLEVRAESREIVICNIDFDSSESFEKYSVKNIPACRSTDGGRNGSGALVLSGDGSGHIMISFEGVAILPGVTYNVTYWVKMPADAAIAAPSGGGAKVFFRCGTNDATRTGTANDGSGEWVKISAGVKSDIAADKIQFCYINPIPGTVVYIDDFILSTSDPEYSADSELYDREYAIRTEITDSAMKFDTPDDVRRWSGTTDGNYAAGEGIGGSGALRIVASGGTQVFALPVQKLGAGLWRLGFSFRVDADANLVKISAASGAKLYLCAGQTGYDRVGMPSAHNGQWQTVSMAVPSDGEGELRIVLTCVPAGTVILIDDVCAGLVDTDAERVSDGFESIVPADAGIKVDFSTDDTDGTGASSVIDDVTKPGEEDPGGTVPVIIGAVAVIAAAGVIFAIVKGRKKK